MFARDVMTAPVITGSSNSTVFEIVDLMLKYQISAVPIVDEDDCLIGIVSEGDLIQRDEIDTLPRRSWWLTAFGGRGLLAEEFIRAHGMVASQIMTREVLTAEEDTPLWEIAETLEKVKIKRLPVVSDNKVVGIISRANLLHALSTQRAAMEHGPSKDDRKLRAEILELLRGEPWTNTGHLNVVVKDGTVHLWGRIDTNLEGAALMTAAKNVAGVKDVVDHTHKAVTLI